MKKRGSPLTLDQIKKAFCELYGNWDLISDHAGAFIENVMRNGNFEKQYRDTVSTEEENNMLLTDFEKSNPNVTNSSNVDAILSMLRAKKR